MDKDIEKKEEGDLYVIWDFETGENECTIYRTRCDAENALDDDTVRHFSIKNDKYTKGIRPLKEITGEIMEKREVWQVVTYMQCGKKTICTIRHAESDKDVYVCAYGNDILPGVYLDLDAAKLAFEYSVDVLTTLTQIFCGPLSVNHLKYEVD